MRTWRSIAASIVVVGLLVTTAVAGRRWVVTSATAGNLDGNTLVASVRSEPQSFNRYATRDFTATVLTYLMHASLVRINRTTNVLEPELAESWERLPDNRTYRLTLRRGVRFSDGSPFSADDVMFSFQAIYDASTKSVLAETLQVDGRPLTITVEDASTVVIRYPAPFSPGLRILDGVPIYPRHRLEPALRAGMLRKAWGPTTPPSDLVGLGPFMLRRYEPGQRLMFDRNPLYWRHAEGLPRLAHLVLEVLPDQTSESLRLETGGIDVTQSEIRAADVPALKRAVEAGRLTLADSGVGLDGDLFWINLRPERARDRRSSWLQRADFRRAIAATVDRRAFADVVYFGAAVPSDGIISPGNQDWHVTAAPPSHDLEQARALLAGLGLADRDRDGVLEDHNGQVVRFTLLTQSGNTSLERGASVIKQDLGRIGITVDIVALERAAMIDYVTRGEYDAAYFRLLTTDVDPALNLDFWMSSGGAHVWNPEQRSPATVWERDIDTLMKSVSTEPSPAKRRALFADVQRIMARELPVICFAFPRLSIAISTRVVDATPAPFRPPVLWNPAVIDVRGASQQQRLLY